MDLLMNRNTLSAVGALVAGGLAFLLVGCMEPRKKRYRKMLENVFSPLYQELFCPEGTNEEDFAAVVGRVLEESGDLAPARLKCWYETWKGGEEPEETPGMEGSFLEELEAALLTPKGPKADPDSFEHISEYVITQYNWCKKKLREVYEKRQINYELLDHYDRKTTVMLISDVALDIALWAAIWIGVFQVRERLVLGLLLITLPISFYLGRTYQRWHQRWGLNRFAH